VYAVNVSVMVNIFDDILQRLTCPVSLAFNTDYQTRKPNSKSCDWPKKPLTLQVNDVRSCFTKCLSRYRLTAVCGTIGDVSLTTNYRPQTAGVSLPGSTPISLFQM